MSTAGQSSPPPISAAVLEFICLFSHDLRRKQKRWQDGRLKYHTFNNRVMVYDDRGNFVGDMHWRHDWDLVEGEEVELERGGVIVQVQELSSRCEQDLSELLDKRAKEKEQRQMQAVARSPAPSALPRTAVRPAVTRPIPLNQVQPRHRSLHQVIGTPSGHHGRASVPKESPFEQKQQAAEAPKEQAVKRRKVHDPPSSKSGYASALFGQALTLSATPMSSVPVVRRRPVRERDPSPEDEDTATQIVQEEFQPPLREQAKSSRHFNQPSVRSRPIETANNTMPSHCDVGGDDEPPVRRQQERQLPRERHSKRRRIPTPVDDEVIEIDNPGATSVEEPVHPVSVKKEATKRPKARTKIYHRPSASSRRIPNSTSEGPDQIDDVPDEAKELHENVSKTQERPERLEKPKAKMPKPASKEPVAKPSATKTNNEHQDAMLSPRSPSVHVTELRIKSRKKRGLMMMSDLSKKSLEQFRDGSPPSLPAVENTKAREVEEADNFFRFPSLRPHEEPHRSGSSRENRMTFQRTKSTELGQIEGAHKSPSPEAQAESKIGKIGGKHRALPPESDSIQLQDENDPFCPPPPSPSAQKKTKVARRTDQTVVQRRISVELGEDDDQFRVPSPVPALLMKATANQGGEDRADGMDVNDSNHEGGFGAAFQMDNDNITAKRIDDIDMVRPLPPQERIYDPYQLPSSPEELFELPSRVVPGPTAGASSNTNRAKDTSFYEVFDEQQLTDDGKRMSKAKRASKRPLKFLRNVVLDEDDEMEASSGAPEQADDGANEAVDSEPDANSAAPEKMGKSKKVIQRKSKVQEASDQDVIGSDPGENPSIKQATKPTKRKSTVHDKEFDPKSKDEQPAKRRRAPRKPRTRTTGLEETPLSSEVEDSEEELSYKASRKRSCKESKDRPRLEKIKKSVKSRELIGFNISALNAPRGLRGIGMPFSVLSSPANESIQRRIDSHGTMEPPLDPWLDTIDEQMPIATPDVLQMVAKADEMASNAQWLRAVYSDQSSKLATKPVGPSLSTGGVDPGRPNKNFKEDFSPALPVSAPHTKGNTEMKDSMPEQREQESPRTQQTSSPEIPQPKKLPTSLIPRERNSDDRADSANVTARLPISEISQLSECHDSLVVGASTVNRSAKEATSTFQRWASTASRTDLALEKTQDVPEPAAGGEKTSVMRGVVAKPFVAPSKKPTAAMKQQNPSNCTAFTSEEVSQETESQKIVEARRAAVPTLPTFKAPEQRPTPALQQQPSSGSNVYTEANPPNNGSKDTIGETTTEEVLEPGEKSGTKPAPGIRRLPPTFKPPSKAKVNDPQTNAGPGLHHDPPGANIEGSEVEKAEPMRLTRVLSRSDSALGQAAAIKTAVNSLDATKSTRIDPQLALPVQRQNCVVLKQTGSVTGRINNLITEPSRSVPVDDATPAETSTRSASNARISNPASRGRKAALKSDAKGPVPQRMLPPTQPFAMIPISTADFASTPIEEPPKEPERPKKKMTFPGFQSARGEGPWSREAFDLLESGRPE